MPRPIQKNAADDVQGGSRAYNRLDMQISQAVLIAITLYDKWDYIIVMDHYDDISIFKSTNGCLSVSYYQMKTSEHEISLRDACSGNWISKLYSHVRTSPWLVDEIGLITTSAPRFGKDEGYQAKLVRCNFADGYNFGDFSPKSVEKIKGDIAQKHGIPNETIDISKLFHIVTPLTISSHRDQAQGAVLHFLRDKCSRLTLEEAYSIFDSAEELLRIRQAVENLSPATEFDIVRTKKGISRSDVRRIIGVTLEISMPRLTSLLKAFSLSLDQDEVRNAYFDILEDFQTKEELYISLFKKVKNFTNENPLEDGQDIYKYANLCFESVKERKYNSYTRHHILIIICVFLYNKSSLEL